MKVLFRMLHAECVKFRHTFLWPLHLLLPAAGSMVFLLYYRFSNWSVEAQVSGFMEVVGVVYPLAVSIVCAKAVELEEDSHFQTFLGVTVRKWQPLLAKWVVIEILGLLAGAAAVGIFFLGERFWLGQDVLNGMAGIQLIGILWIGSLPLYLEHLFWNLKFSKSVSMGIGTAEFLMAALMLTGLGDGRWQFMPCTWASKACQLFLISKEGRPAVSAGIICMAAGCLLITAVIYAIILLYFQYYEGQPCKD